MRILDVVAAETTHNRAYYPSMDFTYLKRLARLLARTVLVGNAKARGLTHCSTEDVARWPRNKNIHPLTLARV
jgi:hypothetical protein